jgi:hypothetical protein
LTGISAAEKLSAFSSKQRANLMDLGCFVIGKARGSTPSKRRVTEVSRQNNFIRFCHYKEIREPTKASIPTDQSNFLLGCYAVALIQGDSILGLNLKADTIKNT